MPETGARRASLEHPAGSGAELLSAELRRLGFRLDPPDPARPDGPAPDIAFVHVGAADDEAALRSIAAAACPVIAVIDGDDAATVRAVAESGVLGMLVLPLRRSAIAAQVALALATAAYQKRLNMKLGLLERSLRSRRAVEKATQVLATVRGLSQAEAYASLRKAAMRKRVSTSAMAESYLATLGDVESSTDQGA